MNAHDNSQMLRQIASQNRQRFMRQKSVPVSVPHKPSKYCILVDLADGGALLFNSMTRAMGRLNEAENELLRSWIAADRVDLADRSKVAIGLFSSLLSDKFVIPVARDELSEFEKAYYDTRNDPNSLMLTVAPTMACNLACGYCFQGLNKDLTKLKSDVPDAIVSLVDAKKSSLNSLSLTWYGGEPLMSKKEIFALSDRLIAVCDKNGINYSASIVTNGYFLTPDIARQLYSRRCTFAQITVDGLKETHDRMRPMTSGRGSYDVIMKNVEDVLRETPLAISMRVNVGRDNVGECEQLIEEFQKRKLIELGRFSMYFAPIDAATKESGTAFEEGLTKKEFNQSVHALMEKARSLGLASPVTPPQGIMGMCVAAKKQGYVITHNGDVHKCWETAHDPTKRIGTVYAPESLDTSVNADIWSEWNPFDNDVCKSCKILPMCGGHCGHRFIYHGSGDENSLPCPDWKWNTAEYLFSRAKAMGVVKDDDWIPAQSTIDAEQSGRRHSVESLTQAQDRVLERVNKKRDGRFNRDYLLHGDGRFFEDLPSDSGSATEPNESELNESEPASELPALQQAEA